jgi:hypothetical protein
MPPMVTIQPKRYDRAPLPSLTLGAIANRGLKQTVTQSGSPTGNSSRQALSLTAWATNADAIAMSTGVRVSSSVPQWRENRSH